MSDTLKGVMPFFYHIEPDFIIADLEFCESTQRTIDITVDALWKNDRLLQSLNFWDTVKHFPGSHPAKWDFGKFCKWLSWKHSDVDKQDEIYKKLLSNPTIRILDITIDSHILKIELRKRKLEKLNQNLSI